ncbi:MULTISPECIES: LysR family transcriptional regulator [unclassified Thalassolituus]|uniref:LysR family transcriptional regulator n=1 Tax=unclassified Thalassolituus TaxID=2624967 RepID=UPI000C66666D|nr:MULTISPECIES: LysR family transcriptional regulator [unclassified Thalassolituus]MAS23921.1 LysR family transcriptional regulator [Oceanospirillaceae bacterium]MBL36332.1 LysR family transcriptional regulator [Oceanospirillaceae bacterium]|tara:strand:- start:1519 stop:2439 length:921 start_codon:yes stop_codon:yes gene_type:complete
MNIHYLRHMVVFSHIVEGGSVSRAAEILGISKSVVSEQLKALEKELGVTLLNRNTRSQAVTAAGQAFYQHCKSLNLIVSQAWGEVRSSQGQAKGSIRISAPNALIEPIVAPALGRLVEQHEGITPTLLGSDVQVNLIRDEINLAIRVGRMPDSDYKQRKIGEFRDVLCASPEFFARNGISQNSLREQSGKKLKMNYVANSWQGTHITHRLSEKGSGRQVELSFGANRMCNSLPAVVEMVRAGCGFAYIPDFVFRKYQQTGELTEAMPDFLCEAAPVYAVHAYSGDMPILVRMAIEAISSRLQSVLP